jgi:hypothetical protein
MPVPRIEDTGLGVGTLETLSDCCVEGTPRRMSDMYEKRWNGS